MDEIRKILSGYTDAPVTESSRLLEDLGLDSFYILHFLSEVEDRFHIDIDAADFEYMITIQDVLDQIRQAM